MKILGLSAYYHDSSAALVVDGKLVAATQEERFTRKKHDSRFPRHSVKYCLESSKLKVEDLDAVVFYDKPLRKFDRLLETYLAYAPKGFPSFQASMPVWFKEKIFLKSVLKRELRDLSGNPRLKPKLLFTEHHQAHAASAYFPSPFDSAAVLCLDGVGEWATTTAWHGHGNKLDLTWEIDFPHSLGLLYSAFTHYAGFKVNSGEYKLMGLAPYGEPRFKDLILKELIDVKADGSFRLNMEYFEFAVGLAMTNAKFHKLFGGEPKAAESLVTQREMDLARSIQVVTEDIVLRLARTIHKEQGVANLCLAGGVALNCVANGRLLREGPFKNIWIQPAAGDAGGAVGAAFAAYHEYFDKPRTPEHLTDAMSGSYLGPEYTQSETETMLRAHGAHYEVLKDDELLDRVSDELNAGKVIGWCQGRMEFGPRSLGNRSILGDPRNPKMQSVMNLKIKYRESFRPFAPAVMAEDVSNFFEFKEVSPYMLFVAPVRKDLCRELTPSENALHGIEKLKVPRSTIPAVTHVDKSARIQTVHKETNPKFYGLLEAFKKKTGCSVLVNTSFNVRGEPIVCSPLDAYRCFMRTEIDCLVIGNCLFTKANQPVWRESKDWRSQLELD